MTRFDDHHHSTMNNSSTWLLPIDLEQSSRPALIEAEQYTTTAHKTATQESVCHYYTLSHAQANAETLITIVIIQPLGPMSLVTQSVGPSTELSLRTSTSANNNVTTIACTTYIMSLCERHVCSTWRLVVTLSENVLSLPCWFTHGWLPEGTPGIKDHIPTPASR